MDYQSWRKRFERVAGHPVTRINLAEAALLVATDEYPDLDVDFYLARLRRMAEHLRPHLPRDLDPEATIRVLNRYLFDELGFTGNREAYYDPRNSYLNDVLDRKLGLPITLGIVYIVLGEHLGLPIRGVGLPGHFIVKWHDPKTEILIDPFNHGQVLSHGEVEARVRDTFNARARFEPEWLEAVNERYILTRLLNNLKAIFVHAEEHMRAWQVVDKLLILDPRSPENIRDMALLSIHTGAYRKAAAFLEEYLLSHGDATDADELRMYLRTVLHTVERLN